MTTTALPSVPLWNPPRQLLSQAKLKQYIDWLFVKKGLYFRNYDDLWDWSVTDLEHFWESICQFFDVQFTTPYRFILQRADDGGLIGTRWFGGATLNYAEHIFRQQTPTRPALLFAAEQWPLRQLSWNELARQVASVSVFLRARGVGIGDRVVAVLPNSPEAVVAFLATNAIGAVWSVCPPDFSAVSTIDRFQPLEPKVLLTVDGYTYAGRPVDREEAARELRQALPTLTTTIWIPCLNRPEPGVMAWQTGHSGASRTLESKPPAGCPAGAALWADVLDTDAPDGLIFEPVPFDHPMWVLFSSGVTGRCRAITHSVGGCLLEHTKLLGLHQDVRPGERYCWYATTGSLMWHVALSSLLVGATLVLYDGAPAYPDLTQIWELTDQAQVNHIGSDTAYLLTCMRSSMQPVDMYRLATLRTISTTGGVLPIDGFQWVYDCVKADVWLIPAADDTDLCSTLVGGNPLLPVYPGEIQGRLLGCKIDVFDEEGQSTDNQPGELVLLKPMPSMPVSVWNDPHDPHYRRKQGGPRSAVWWSGDWVSLTNHHTVVAYGRADATLNRDGMRLGTAEIYNTVEQLAAVVDSLIVGVERPGGTYFIPLFVVLSHGMRLDEALANEISRALQNRFGPRHAPDEIIQVEQIPYTISGRKLEVPIRKLLMGTDVSLIVSRYSLRNPAALDQFVALIGDITARW